MNPTLAGIVGLLTTPAMLLALAAGSIAGIVAGLLPGVSGRSALLIALPFVLGMPPLTAAVLLVALHASAQISGTVPAALFGAPTSASEAATAIDGYPLSARGEGGKVVGAILGSSTLGGALAMLFIAPFGGRFILLAGTPEIAAFAAVGIIAIAAVSSSGLAIGIAVGAAGALVSTVGFDAMSGVERLTFGFPDIVDGLSTPAVVTGLIAVPELLRQYARTSKRPVTTASIRDTARGLIEPLRHGWLTLRAGLLGFIIGFLPGLGTTVAVWMAYSHATRSTTPTVPFGQGAIEGVIAPEAANGAKEGGAYIPTLLLGVPGSSGMAIILGAFAVIGIHVGPSLFRTMPQFTAVVGSAVILADVVALLVCLLSAPLMVGFASLNRRIVTSISLSAAIAATYFTLPQAGTALQILFFGAIGVVMLLTSIARPPFLIGFIVGPILESALRRSAIIYGWHAFERPGVFVTIAIVLVGLVFMTWRRRAVPDRLHERDGKPGRRAIMPMVVLAAAGAAAIILALPYGAGSNLMPLVAASVALTAAVLAIMGLLLTPRGPRAARPDVDYPLAAILSAGLALCAAFGPLALALPLINLVLPDRRPPAASSKS
jgi:putative tricarboxylic transport membrane protein